MKINKFKSIICLLIILISCSNKTNWFIEKYPNGKIKKKYEGYISGNDTIWNGTYLEYYENGKIKLKCKYSNNILSDSSIRYYENGTISSKVADLNGEHFGSCYSYYRNGNLREYKFFDYDYHMRYHITYDSLSGKILHEIGFIIGQVKHEVNLDSLKLGEDFGIEVCVSHPPDYNVKAYYRLYDHEILLAKYNPNLTKYSTMIVGVTCKEKGNFTLIAYGEFYNDKDKLVKRDSIPINFTVR